MKDSKGGILRFIWISVLFGGAGFCALSFLVIRNPRWFALYWRVMRFFAGLPAGYKRMKQEVTQGRYREK